MKEQIVSFKTAKMLAEIGFNVPCYDAYNKFGSKASDGWLEYLEDTPARDFSIIKKDYLKDGDILAPTQSLAQKWLREKYDKHIIVNPTVFKEYQFTVYKTFDRIIIYPRDVFKTYEQAFEKGLQEAIKIIRDE